jgi:two-component system sensor histidine kinase PilS (NtrC family)
VLEDEIKGVRGVIGIFQNLTDAKKMEEKMRHADRLAAVGELSASIAHEIRNPLASISGSVELLKQELNLEGENRRLMSLIVKESSRLSNILTDFLVYARVKTPNFGKVEINRLVSDVIEVARKHSSYRESIKLGIESDDTTIYVSGDDEQIRQVILNLVVNALDSIETEEGEVNIGIEGDSQIYPDQVIISVSDTGGGMTSEVRDKIFTPFFSTKKNGTGLGLAIVRRLVDNMGGIIWVESSPHGGTTFKFTMIKYFKGMNSSDDNEHNIPENTLEGMTSESPLIR